MKTVSNKNKNYTKVRAREEFEKTFSHMIDFAQLKDLLLQNVEKSASKSFTQYTKDTVQTYIQNPYSNIDNLREVSRFLERVSMPYKKILEYYSLMPLFYYNVVFKGNLQKEFDGNKFKKNYSTTIAWLQNINMKNNFSSVIYNALRDGVYYGFVNDGNGDGFFLQELDTKYCKISGKTNYNTYTFKFDATYFDKGNNKEFIYGINNDGIGVWDDVFIQGYEDYKNYGSDFRWFDMPADKSICIPCGDDFTMPLPYFIPIFTALLGLIDLESILQSRTELENYVLLVSKIPLLSGADEADQFAVSLPLVQYMQELIDTAMPMNCGTAYSPCDIEKITFERSNTASESDALSKSYNNLMNNVGISEVLFNSGSTNSVGLKHSIDVDESFIFKFLDRIEEWINFYITMNISEDFVFKFHKFSNMTKSDYVSRMKDGATLGAGAMNYLTSLGMTPYEANNMLLMEKTMGIVDLMTPLSSSYTSNTTSGETGRPQSDLDDLSESGLATRDGNKNGSM